MAKLTATELANASAFFAGEYVPYASLLAANVGVKIGEEIPAEVVGDFGFDDEEGAYLDTVDGREIRVIETELYVAAEDVATGEVAFFALEEIEE
ncbi:hypothetical protein KYLE_112 [Pantoea phage Kyle]|uniref:Uncharacterized protein n=1 Tax=Pantoea phage Kyle TaxID=2589665 RepID=A0A514A8I1_9CAUD|nr:hypothetical protein HWC52_gp006 [Pantoea phage Kyle]YP_009849944.1 hypothetical protein HWC52_gp112 [Pantoea phage Kyle]QDH49576.1 hypothetical protein KYLE_6 [Pantoea phage Kyle]QDH49600.1 hypothetical protein KYLE_112 [Pantoea phage Kyle]